MPNMDHWHPVALSTELDAMPKAIVLNGEEIVVFADTDSGATRVVYRRPDGSLKLIEVSG